VQNKVIDWGPKPFKTFDVWQNTEGFKEVVKNSWEQPMHRDNSLELVKDKLKQLKRELKQWRVEVYNKEVNQEKKLLEELGFLDKCDDDGMIHEELRLKRIHVLKGLNMLNEKEILVAKQKARIEWLKKGDTNCRYYHSKIKWRMMNNGIKGLHIEEEWTDNLVRIQVELKSYFQEKFPVQNRLGINLDGIQFRSITEADNEMLCRAFSEQEILEAVGNCESTKSLRPDGFNFHFIKSN